MLAWADDEWLRSAAYLMTAVACVVAARFDRGASGHWAPFWPVTAALFVAMTIGRTGQLAEWATEVARQRAYDDGWYPTRRRLQAAVAVAVGVLWAITVAAAIWRVPARRRHYLSIVVASLSAVAFVALRVVSLHQIDTVLHRREVEGLRVGTLAEYTINATTLGAVAWVPLRAFDRRAAGAV